MGWIKMSSLIVLLSCFCMLIFVRSCRRYIQRTVERSQIILNIDAPTIFFGRILHIRHFPALHSFCYSYLLVGVPVRYNDRAGSTIVSVDSGPSTTRGWLRVEAEDHFGRGRNAEGLRKKLDRYLESQGIDPSRYEKVYLVTTPRIFNHHFTPASFWYLYTEDGNLDTMIAEVNNTFNERRAYIVFGESVCDPQGPTASTPNTNMRNRARWFKSKGFSKDFHVSPFSSRKGSYLLSARNPLTTITSQEEQPSHPESQLDIKVKLLSSKGHLKLYARTWCDGGNAINADSMSKREHVALLITWLWMARITYCQIVIEALKLSWLRKLRMWYRPEPRKESVPRRATAAEQVLSQTLYKYLMWLGRSSGQYNIVNSEDSGDGYIQKYSIQPSARSLSPIFILNINTPALYSSIPGNDDILGFIEDSLLGSHFENRTASCCQNSEDLLSLLDSAIRKIGPVNDASSNPLQTPLTSLLWYFIQLVPLKAPPTPYRKEKPAVKAEPASRSSGRNTIEKSYTFLFVFVQKNCTAREQWQFQIAVLQVLGWRLLVTLSGGLLAWGA